MSENNEQVGAEQSQTVEQADNSASTTEQVEEQSPQIPEEKIKEAAIQVKKALESDIEKTAAAKADEILKNKLKKLVGEEEERPNQIHEFFEKDPETLLSSLVELSTQKAKEEITEAQKKERAAVEAIAAVASEYPEVTEYVNKGYAIAPLEEIQREHPEWSYDRQVRAAVEKMAQDLKLKKLSDEEKQLRARQSAIPPVGGVPMSGGVDFNPEASAQNFVKALQEAHKARTIKGYAKGK
ncbi:MAG: hypothetical protein D6694_12770 [Gammaproteobacteria bacterium]|nr:MAG: hypothetical protein D6694_12770 [Gammaproteobacteria bacterium]